MYFTRIDSGYACMTNTGLLHYKQAGSFMPFWGGRGHFAKSTEQFCKKRSFLLTFFPGRHSFCKKKSGLKL